MSLQYANKAVKDAKELVDMAIRLWGDTDEVAQLNKERENFLSQRAIKKMQLLKNTTVFCIYIRNI